MSAILLSVADGVAAEINAHSFGGSLTFEAKRNYADFDLKLEEMDELVVDVVPVGYPQVDLATRADGHFAVNVDVGLRYKFPQTDSEEPTGRIDPAAIDALVLLTEEFMAFLESPDHRRLAAYDEATFASLEVRTVAPRNFLRPDRQFLAILRVTYDVNESL